MRWKIWKQEKIEDTEIQMMNPSFENTKKRCYCDMDVDDKGEFHLKHLDGYYAENQTN